MSVMAVVLMTVSALMRVNLYENECDKENNEVLNIINIFKHLFELSISATNVKFNIIEQR